MPTTTTIQATTIAIDIAINIITESKTYAINEIILSITKILRVAY